MTARAGWKTCPECGQEKPLSKFYRKRWGAPGHMEECKSCHNGLTERNERRRARWMPRQPGDPSECAIAEACEQIRAGWSDRVKKRRRERPWWLLKQERSAGE